MTENNTDLEMKLIWRCKVKAVSTIKWSKVIQKSGPSFDKNGRWRLVTFPKVQSRVKVCHEMPFHQHPGFPLLKLITQTNTRKALNSVSGTSYTLANANFQNRGIVPVLLLRASVLAMWASGEGRTVRALVSCQASPEDSTTGLTRYRCTEEIRPLPGSFLPASAVVKGTLFPEGQCV
ncbi:hypothetical protein P7K49_024079 [Saguinus oedipus]|uniref:Uncharacterized protein n=1 Tax=Saguinus oedipus TaxID=9490 RepID=A0ABQ9UNI7_SAGOE|nr:hypothetical protein P7K49_024079 [Saguinus oedipus]